MGDLEDVGASEGDREVRKRGGHREIISSVLDMLSVRYLQDIQFKMSKSQLVRQD